jgi:arylsulfatase
VSETSGMGRRRFLRAAGAGLASAPAILSGKDAPPNILLLMTDQQRFDSLSCYGERAIRTPNLDRLAAGGALFERCYVDNPICTPSRASLMTGKSLPGHGVYRLYDNLPQDEILFPRHLQKAGYRTALFGKLHVSGRLFESSRRNANDGFDVYEWCMEPSIHLDSPFNGYTRWLAQHHPHFLEELRQKGRRLEHAPRDCQMTHWAAERTIDLIRSSRPGQPFFCMTSVFDPHNPYEGYPPEMLERVDRGAIPDPVLPKADLSASPYGIRYESEHGYMGSFRKFSAAQIRQMRAGYLASIALFDLEVGRVLAALEEKGIAGNTLVLFTSDHGDMLGDHRLFAKGAFFYDPCVRVPLLLRWPDRLRGGRRIRQIVQSRDIAATVLSAAGMAEAERKTSMPESADLLNACRDGDARLHNSAICCYRNSGIFDEGGYADPPIHATMLREERYKLNVYHCPQPAGGNAEGELYDMEKDPTECANLWDDAKHRDVRSRMTDSLLGWLSTQERRLGTRGGEMVPDGSHRLNNSEIPSGAKRDPAR